MQVGDFVLADHIDKPAAGSNENDRTSGPVSYVEICFGNTLALANLAGMGKAMNDTNVVRKSRTFWGLLAITIVYFGAYYLLVLETEICVSNTIPTAASSAWLIESWHRFVGFWDSYLSCRQVNELGDALAGAFAPVAFLWLAGAVHIQSQELAAQRYEINETQQVMLAQLEVARQQVEETRASTALLIQQTALLKEQRNQEVANRKFDAQVSFVAKMLLERQGDLQISVTRRDTVTGLSGPPMPHEHTWVQSLLDDRTEYSDHTKLFAHLLELTERILDLPTPPAYPAARFSGSRPFDPYKASGTSQMFFAPIKSYLPRDAFRAIAFELQKLEKIIEQVSADYAIKANILRLPTCISKFHKLVQLLECETDKLQTGATGEPNVSETWP